MIRGLSGRLISASFVRDVLPSIGGYRHASAADLRRLARWRDHVDAALGPASSTRAITDVSVIPLLEILGFAVQARIDHPGRTEIETSCQGRSGPSVLVVPWNVSLSRAWRETMKSSPWGNSRWVITINGIALRLVDTRRSWSREYLELDLAHLEGNTGIAALLWSFVHSTALVGDGSLLERAIELSEQHGLDICDALGRGVLAALTHLLEGLRQPQARNTATTSLTSRAFEEALTVVYRVLFLLFAEARGLVPMWHPIYRDRYSVGTIVSALLEGRGWRGLWPSVQAISRLAHGGCRAGDLRVNAFNGNLFSASASAALDRVRLRDDTMAVVLTSLGAAESRLGQRPIVYRDLDVEQLGHVYERVLDYAPATAATKATLTRSGDARKLSGSFYTPRQVTAYLVQRTLLPLVEGRSADEILQLRVLDPAMGSGAFLVAACRYLARRIEDALILEGRWHPDDVTPAERSDLRREVASRCLYGVDLNPTAVQLARLSLWLATLAGDKPLSFLDHRLVCGDSLVGARPEDLQRQPPGARRLARRPDVLPLFDDGEMKTALHHAATIRECLARQADVSAAVVRDKEVALAALTASDTPVARWSRVFDLWCSGWFWSNEVPLERSLFNDLAQHILHDCSALPNATISPLLAHAALVAAKRRFLHWPLVFPEVFEGKGVSANGGFDAVLGNPPWDMVRGDSGADAVRDERRMDARMLTRFVRTSGIYRLDSEAHVNRYQLFVERALQLVRPGGRIGMVLPSGVMTDAGAAPLRRHLFAAAEVDAVTGLDNRHAIFPIHRSVRFALTTCTVGGPTIATACQFGIARIDDLERPPSPIVISRSLLQRISGDDDLGIPEASNALDLQIVERTTAVHPWLGATEGWSATFGRELNVTDDRGRFRAFRAGDEARAVLEGKQIDAFRIALDRCRFALRHGERLPASARRQRLVYRDVASAGNRMTLIAAIAPAHVVTTHTLFCLKTPLPLDEQRVLCALLNSFVANFLIRLRVNTHVTASLISRLPVPVVRREHPAFPALLELARLLLDSAAPVESLDAYIDLQARVGHLYGLTNDQFSRVLETFPLVDPAVRQRTLQRFINARGQL